MCNYFNSVQILSKFVRAGQLGLVLNARQTNKTNFNELTSVAEGSVCASLVHSFVLVF